MGKELDLNGQLELYSNAIVGFVVVQGLAFLYQFGTNQTFKGLIQGHHSLSLTLIAVFICVLVASLYANHAISKTLQRRTDPSDRELIKKIFYGKGFVIILFNLLQILVVTMYGLMCIKG